MQQHQQQNMLTSCCYVGNNAAVASNASSAVAAAAAAAVAAGPSSCADLLLAADSFIKEQQKLRSLLPQLSIAKMDPLSQVFCLRWNNHRNNLLTVLDHLLQTEIFCDVTIACDGASVKCHKMILSACSSYFQSLFMENTCEHPIVFLKDMKYEEVRAILDYMYKGEVNVAQEQLPGLLKVAELLKVKGLVEEEREKLLHSGAKEGRPIVTTSGAAAGNGGSPPDDHEPRSSSVASSSSKVNGGHGGGSGSVDLKEPPVTSPGGTNLVRPPFMAGHPNFPMWPFFPNAGMMGGANGNNNRDRDSRDSSRDNNNGNASSSSSSLDRLDSGSSNIKEGSPGPKEGGGSSSAKRKKTASGSGGSNSSKEGRGDRHDHAAGGMPQLNDSIPGHPGLTLGRGGPLNDNDKLHDDDMEKEGNGMMHLPPGLDRHQLANYVPNQKLEWKRYKQYTRSDIMAAIEEVKKGMSALQASRKYGVPSRTLYDKVKKMGITTGRQMQRKSLPQYPASFPSLGGLMGMDSYKDMADRGKDDDNTNDSNSHPGDGLEGRATLVPPPGSFPTLQMLNIMEKMKENDRSGKGDSSEISLMPMNLSTMLNNTRSRDSSISGLSLSSIHQQLGHPGLLGHHPGGLGSAPGGDRRQQLHQQQHSDSSMSPNGGDAEMDEEEGVDVEDEGGSSTKDRARNPSAEIRAQFMADLRRLGGNIPTSSSGGGGAPDHPDSSVGSPPPPSSSATTATPTKLPPTPSEDTSLPPRKRKVSQEHHNLSSSSETTEKYNGIHEKSSTPTNGPEDLTPKDEVKDSPPVEVSN